MIRLTCDNCEKPIDVADDMAGQKFKCPACGDVNVIPALAKKTSAAAPGPDRAAAAGYPAADGPETPVLTVRRAMFRAKPARFCLLVLGLLAGAAGAGYFMLMRTPSNPALAIITGLVALACLVILLGWRISASGEILQITNKRSMGRTGILSKATSDVMHRDVRNIQVTQSFRERLFGVGTLCISSAAEDDHEILVKDIPRPEKVRDVIDLYRT